MKTEELRNEIAAYLWEGFTLSQIRFILNRERGESLTDVDVETVGFPIQDEIIAERRRDAAHKAAETRRARKAARIQREAEKEKQKVQAALEKRKRKREELEEREIIETVAAKSGFGDDTRRGFG